jgi:hypothetical protein
MFQDPRDASNTDRRTDRRTDKLTRSLSKTLASCMHPRTRASANMHAPISNLGSLTASACPSVSRSSIRCPFFLPILAGKTLQNPTRFFYYSMKYLKIDTYTPVQMHAYIHQTHTHTHAPTHTHTHIHTHTHTQGPRRLSQLRQQEVRRRTRNTLVNHF